MKLLNSLIWILVCLLIAVPSVFAETASNSLKEISVQMTEGQPVVHIVSDQPVGYRYTVYDSIDPVRVVVDFPRMTLGEVKSPIKVGVGGIQEIRLSTFDLSLGSLVRAEVLMDASAEYRVDFSDNEMQLTFAGSSGAQGADTAAVAEVAIDAKVAADKIAADKIAADKVAADKVAADKIAADKIVADKIAADKVAADKVAADKIAADKIAADKIAADKIAADKAVADKAVAGEVSTAMVSGSVATVVSKGNKVNISVSAGMDRLRYFTLENPVRLVVDLYGVSSVAAQKVHRLSGGFSQLRVGPYADKLRFVFDASNTELPQFSVNRDGDTVLVAWVAPAQLQAVAPREYEQPSATVSSIDFTAENGISAYRIGMTGPVKIDSPVKEGNIVKFGIQNATMSRALRRVYTALAFPTAVQSVTPYLIDNGKNSDIRFVVQLKGDVPYELITDDEGVVFRVTDGHFAEAKPTDEIRPIKVVSGPIPVRSVSPGDEVFANAQEGTVDTPQAVDSTTVKSAELPISTTLTATKKPEAPVVTAPVVTTSLPVEESAGFNGEKISLIFDNISVRNVLQLIAEVSDLNIIASDEIKGNVTLRLTDVPWDQALNLVLDITNLGMIQEGNVVRVLPKDAIRSMREAELTALRSQEKLEPTVTEVITVSYADLGVVSTPARDLLSDRGSITEDARNKLLIVNDVATRIEKVRELIQILDTPERQVMIEARIVEVNSNYSRDLGVNWGLDFNNPGHKLGDGQLGVGGDFSVGLPAGAGSASTVAGLGAGITFGRIGIDQAVLDLRISALESIGSAKVISTPRITTLNGEEATISQGTTIPYQTSGADGPKTEFIAAELKLKVKPVINPDNSVILEILATNDSPSITAGASAPSIDTKKAETKVLVRDGETTVIGGIFINTKSESETGMPILKDIPMLGHLFKSTKITDTKAELMIFITPRILNNN